MTLKYLAPHQTKWNNKKTAEKTATSDLQKCLAVLNKTFHVMMVADPLSQENSSIKRLGQIKYLMAGLQ